MTIYKYLDINVCRNLGDSCGGSLVKLSEQSRNRAEDLVTGDGEKKNSTAKARLGSEGEGPAETYTVFFFSLFFSSLVFHV